MKDDMDLMDNLRRLAAVPPREASPAVERKLLAAFRRANRWRSPRLWTYAAAVAAAALLIFGVSQVRKPTIVSVTYSAPGFTELPYAQSGVPAEFVVVLRVEMRPAELTSLGVTVPSAPPSGKVTADLLIAQDGVPRAVRFVQ